MQNGTSVVDFDLHGLLGIRLVDATEAEVAVVEHQVGPIQKPLAREPDIVIRWANRLAKGKRLRVLGDHEVAFSDEAFFLLRGKQKSRTRVQIPFESIGERCEIICERPTAAVPLLVPIIHLTLLGKGIVPVHASAFIYRGRGVLAAGWSKGGKTEALLSFLEQGAQYVADDWVYISADGRHLYGIPEPVQLRSWHLDGLPNLRRRVPLLDRLQLWPLGLADRLKDSPTLGRRLSNTFLGRLLHFAGRQAFVKIPPQRLFTSRIATQPIPFHQLFLMGSHCAEEICIEPVNCSEVARRMVFSVQEERDALMSYYRKFRFAFPDRRNLLLDQSEVLQRELLIRALKDKPALAVWHPYPLQISRLYETMHPWIGPGAQAEPDEAVGVCDADCPAQFEQTSALTR